MRPVLSAAATVGCFLAVAAPAAASIPVDLRVEGANGRALTADRFQTDSTSITTTKQPPNCNGTGATKELAGPTALGVLADGALVNSRIDPLLVSDEFSFGLLVCGIGGDNGDSSSFWLYKVNHVSPEVGGDQFKLKRGDDVLWYFSSTLNTGDELSLTAPRSAVRGSEFPVEVSAFDSQGVARPIQGAHVTGGSQDVVTDADGIARMSVNRSGTATLRATLDPNIPSAPTKVCVSARLSSCSGGAAKTIWGSAGRDRIAGRSGRDRILAGGGNDVISVRRGSVDRVRCGRGRDLVRAGARDRVARDCERVRVRGRQ
jgi:Ca2+-binding RTX toxin-like protein